MILEINKLKSPVKNISNMIPIVIVIKAKSKNFPFSCTSVSLAFNDSKANFNPNIITITNIGIMRM